MRVWSVCSHVCQAFMGVYLFATVSCMDEPIFICNVCMLLIHGIGSATDQRARCSIQKRRKIKLNVRIVQSQYQSTIGTWMATVVAVAIVDCVAVVMHGR